MNTASTTDRMISTIESCVAVIGCFSVTRAAIVTKTATPPMQTTIERMDIRSSGTPEMRELTIAVMTSAIAPSGCTTVIGASVRLVSWSTTASPSNRVPMTHDGRASSAVSCLMLSPVLPS